MPFYCYWDGREDEFGIGELLCQNFLYIFLIDFWFYALLAHDGRTADVNYHMKHHHCRTDNYGLYWGL